MSRSKQPIVEWKEVVAATNDGVAIFEEKRVVHVDDRFAAVFGFGESATMEGRRWETLFPQKVRQRLESEILPTARRAREWQGQIAAQDTTGSS